MFCPTIRPTPDQGLKYWFNLEESLLFIAWPQREEGQPCFAYITNSTGQCGLDQYFMYSATAPDLGNLAGSPTIHNLNAHSDEMPLAHYFANDFNSLPEGQAYLQQNIPTAVTSIQVPYHVFLNFVGKDNMLSLSACLLLKTDEPAPSLGSPPPAFPLQGPQPYLSGE